MGALVELKDQGKIRHVGLSNVDEAQLRIAQQIVPVVSVQNRYNVTDRHSESMLDLCEQEQIAFLPYSPVQDFEDNTAVAGDRGAPRRHRDAGGAGVDARPIADDGCRFPEPGRWRTSRRTSTPRPSRSTRARWPRSPRQPLDAAAFAGFDLRRRCTCPLPASRRASCRSPVRSSDPLRRMSIHDRMLMSSVTGAEGSAGVGVVPSSPAWPLPAASRMAAMLPSGGSSSKPTSSTLRERECGPVDVGRGGVAGVDDRGDDRAGCRPPLCVRRHVVALRERPGAVGQLQLDVEVERLQAEHRRARERHDRRRHRRPLPEVTLHPRVERGVVDAVVGRLPRANPARGSRRRAPTPLPSPASRTRRARRRSSGPRGGPAAAGARPSGRRRGSRTVPPTRAR